MFANVAVVLVDEVQRLFDGTEVAVEDAEHSNHNPNPSHLLCMSMTRHLIAESMKTSNTIWKP